jgi:hypothetical protein
MGLHHFRTFVFPRLFISLLEGDEDVFQIDSTLSLTGKAFHLNYYLDETEPSA